MSFIIEPIYVSQSTLFRSVSFFSFVAIFWLWFRRGKKTSNTIVVARKEDASHWREETITLHSTFQQPIDPTENNMDNFFRRIVIPKQPFHAL